MASPATTSLSLGTIFDLIGPPAPASPGKGQPAFGELLQPASPPPSCAAVVDDRSSALPCRNTDDRQDDKDSPPAPLGSPQPATENDQPSTRHEASQDGTPPSAHPPEHNESTPKDESHTEEAVVAESLAGLTAVASAANKPIAPAGSKDVAESDLPAIEPAATSKENSALPHGAELPAKLAAATTTDNVAAAGPVQPVTVATKSTDKEQKSSAKTESADPLKDDATATAVGDHAGLDSAAASEANKSQSATTQQPAAEAHHQTHEAAENFDNSPATSALNLDVTAQLDTAAPSTALAAAQVAGASQPTQAAGENSAAGSVGSNPVGAITGVAANQRSRLPSEVLTPASGGTNRRTGVEVDATRLLSRVARAFTAAQERDGEIRLRLSPPELGSLRLDVRVQDGALVAHLQTETDAARTAILDNLPALRERLADQGVRIERFDVDLMQRQPGGMPDQPGGREHDAPTPLRVVPSPRSSAATTVSSVPTAAASNSSGLNVIV
jgi:flagellar hook-length control protein FliK